MRLHVKTLKQKSIMLDFDETKTVLELKHELSRYPDVGVKPELQKLIYAGKILSNEDELSTYNIDVKKFLVVMILKQPLEDPPLVLEAGAAIAASTSVNEPVASDGAAGVTTTPPTNPRTEPERGGEANPQDILVQRIVGMGYNEPEVRQALAASYNNPELAIEYLIEGIPYQAAVGQQYSGEQDDAHADLTPFEVFRSDPMFRHLRRAILQHPDLINETMAQIAQTNPSLISLVNENQQEFLSLLLDSSEEDGFDEDDSGSM